MYKSLILSSQYWNSDLIAFPWLPYPWIVIFDTIQKWDVECECIAVITYIETLYYSVIMPLKSDALFIVSDVTISYYRNHISIK